MFIHKTLNFSRIAIFLVLVLMSSGCHKQARTTVEKACTVKEQYNCRSIETENWKIKAWLSSECHKYKEPIDLYISLVPKNEAIVHELGEFGKNQSFEVGINFAVRRKGSNESIVAYETSAIPVFERKQIDGEDGWVAVIKDVLWFSDETFSAELGDVEGLFAPEERGLKPGKYIISGRMLPADTWVDVPAVPVEIRE